MFLHCVCFVLVWFGVFFFELPSAAYSLVSHALGFSGADIHNVCNEAALIAARKDLTGMLNL
jgi:SpoVK/Ycf46/Vps4 family AAA+-type ATPase